MQAKASKIVILCYFPSISYLIIYCKNIQNIKNYQALPDVTCVHNKYGGSCPQGQSLLRYQPVCL